MPTSSGTRTNRVAIVDVNSSKGQVLAALHEHGAECVHVQSPDPDVVLGQPYDPEGFVDGVQHDGDVAATASALREYGVSRLIAIGESGVELAAQLAAELGIPGNGLSRPNCRRDKYEMFLALRDAGLAHAATIVSSDADEIIEWAEADVGYPVVLKPVASCGTDNVMACPSPEQVRAAHEKIMSSTDRFGKTNETVLAQEFLDGNEYYVNTVSRNGTHRTVDIWRYYKIPDPSGTFVYDYDEPLAPDDPDAQKLERYTHEVLDALEIHNGAAHTEVMLTARGPVLVECAARIGGAHAPDVLRRCFGTNQVDMLALSVAKPEEFDRLPTTARPLLQRTRSVSLINPRDSGVVPSHELMAEIRALPSHAYTSMWHPVGRRLPRTIDAGTAPGLIYLVSDDPAEILADYQKLRQIERDYLYDGNSDGEPAEGVSA
jgi:biotin carboxylase